MKESQSESDDKFWDYYSGLPNPSWYKKFDKPQYDSSIK
jgi:hypothetical protein